MDKQEAIERLKQNKAAAEFYAGMTQISQTMENELKDIEAFDMAIEALQAQTDGDLISRADAIDAMWKALYAYEDLTEKQFMEHEELELEDWFQHRIFVQRMHEECMKAVNSLPSAEQKTGEWIENVVRWGNAITIVHGYKCSECGALNLCKDKFCPNCGIRMRVGGNK